MGPWPISGLERPWDRAGTIQHRSNIWVVQNPLPCLPCEKPQPVPGRAVNSSMLKAVDEALAGVKGQGIGYGA
jgi:hypothetical protein